MNFSDIAKLRLLSQQIEVTKFKTPKAIVSWMGAMQAQDYSMAKWAIGIRLPNSSKEIINSAINKGEILRTHLMRPTWHFVSADDIYWMLELTAPKIRSSMKSRHHALELTNEIKSRSNKIIGKSLAKRKYLTREEVAAELKKNKISLDNNRLSHLLAWAELNGIICSGPEKGNKITYALLDDRVPNKIKFSRDKALANLAEKYFTSHAPATIKDFSWWSGLTLNESRKALDFVKSKFITKTLNSTTYILPDNYIIPEKNNKSVHLLPSYDEFIISYADRSAALSSKKFKITVSSNGVFHPIILLEGKATGLWKRSFKKDKINIEANLYISHSNSEKELIKKAAKKFGDFMKQKIELKFNS